MVCKGSHLVQFLGTHLLVFSSSTSGIRILYSLSSSVIDYFFSVFPSDSVGLITKTLTRPRTKRLMLWGVGYGLQDYTGFVDGASVLQL